MALGDVGDPRLAGPGRDELAVDPVRRDVGLEVLRGDRERPPAAVAAGELRGPHQPGDALAADAHADVGELGADPRRLVHAAVGGERHPDLLGQHQIGDQPRRPKTCWHWPRTKRDDQEPRVSSATGASGAPLTSPAMRLGKSALGLPMDRRQGREDAGGDETVDERS